MGFVTTTLHSDTDSILTARRRRDLLHLVYKNSQPSEQILGILLLWGVRYYCSFLRLIFHFSFRWYLQNRRCISFIDISIVWSLIFFSRFNNCVLWLFDGLFCGRRRL